MNRQDIEQYKLTTLYENPHRLQLNLRTLDQSFLFDVLLFEQPSYQCHLKLVTGMMNWKLFLANHAHTASEDWRLFYQRIKDSINTSLVNHQQPACQTFLLLFGQYHFQEI